MGYTGKLEDLWKGRAGAWGTAAGSEKVPGRQPLKLAEGNEACGSNRHDAGTLSGAIWVRMKNPR